MPEVIAGILRGGCSGRRRRAVLVAMVLLAALSVAWRYSALLAPIHAADLGEPSGRLVRFTDRDGHLLASLVAQGDSACQPVRLDQVPDTLVHAFIAAEDKRFYRHGGVDYLAIARSACLCVWRRRVVAGGSTLTMQLARLLSPKARTPLNKLREMRTAWRLEAGMTKGEILDAYLNRVPMGGNLMGVGAASRVFLDREPQELNLAEAALLASIPADPAKYDPRRGLQRVGARRSYVLAQMVKAGFVTRDEAELAGKSGVEICSEGDTLAVYQFLFRVMESAPEGATVIRVTLDRETQQMAAEQVRVVLGELADRDVTNAAAIVLDNRNGEVLAYVGSASFFDEEHAGQVDGVQAPRQPGSTLKPFVYALALERGFTPATVLPDVPTAYPMAPEQQYEPENYSNEFHGPVLLRSALANSLNVPACHVASRIGVPDMLSQLHRFGFDSLDKNADYYGLGVVLGGGEVTLYELARAYMALARDGAMIDPVECLEVDDQANGMPDGQEVTRPGVRARVCRPDTGYLIADILSDRDARSLAFGPRSPLDLPFACAAKTGTSSGHRDNWAVGYTRDYTVAAWVGNFDGHPMRGVSGISGAGPLFARIMYHLYGERAGPPSRDIPAGIVRRPVCSLSGKRPSSCCPHLREELFPAGALADYAAGVCDWHRLDGAGGGPDRLRTVAPEEFRVDSSREDAGSARPSLERDLQPPHRRPTAP